MNLGVCARFLGLLAASVLSACSVELPPDVERVADGVYLFVSGEDRSLFIVTVDGVIATDPLNVTAARRYREAIATITDQPVRYLVYSHYHWDRVSGGSVFAADGAKIVAQQRCAERFRSNPNPDVVAPDITFDDHYTVSLGGQSLALFYFGPAHGDCTTVFLARPSKLLQIVDVVNPPKASFPDNALASYVRPHNIREFFASVQELVARENVEQIVAHRVRWSADGPGKVEPSPPTGPVEIIAEQARFWDLVRQTVETARAAEVIGIDSMVPSTAIDHDSFRAFDGYDEEGLPMIMRRFVGFHDMGR